MRRMVKLSVIMFCVGLLWGAPSSAENFAADQIPVLMGEPVS